jgi:hypothetical protein
VWAKRSPRLLTWKNKEPDIYDYKRYHFH